MGSVLVFFFFFFSLKILFDKLLKPKYLTEKKNNYVEVVLINLCVQTVERNTRSRQVEILNNAIQDFRNLSEIITTFQNSPNGHSFGEINDIT